MKPHSDKNYGRLDARHRSVCSEVPTGVVGLVKAGSAACPGRGFHISGVPCAEPRRLGLGRLSVISNG